MKGILFKSDMIKAIVEGGKTQTRRIDKGLEEINKKPDKWDFMRVNNDGRALFWRSSDTASTKFEDPDNVRLIKPRYQVGEVVYIKEAHFLYGVWAFLTADQDKPMPQREWRFVQSPDYSVRYLENPPERIERNRYGGRGWYLRSPMFFKAEYARYFIQKTDVKPQRLQEIENRPEDFKAEGYMPLMIGLSAIDGKPFEASCDWAWYENLWDTINPKFKYATNPWIWRYEFKKVDKLSS